MAADRHRLLRCTAGQGKACVQLQKRPKALEKSLLKKPESYLLRAVSGCSEEFEEVHSPATKAQMTYYCIGTLKKDEQYLINRNEAHDPTCIQETATKCYSSGLS